MISVSDTDPLLHNETENVHNSGISEANGSTPHASPSPNSEEDEAPEGKCARVGWVLRKVTVEPVLLFYIIGWSVQAAITTNMLLEKVCREQNFNPEVCANLSAHLDAQTSVQEEVSTINMYLELLTNIPAVFFALFLGSWSDKHGRKIPMLLPPCGSLIATLVYLGNAYWFESPSMYILLAAIPRALTGSLITLLLSCFSYMADITKMQSRTMRIAFLDMGFAIGPPIGLLSSDILFSKFGYLGVYGVSAVFFFIAVLYTVVRVEDTRGRYSKYNRHRTELAQPPGNMCKDLCDVNNVRDTFRTAMKPRPHKGRTKILLLMVTLCTMIFIFGAMNIDYLYTKRKFGWEYSDYLHYSLTQQLFGIIGTSIILPVFSFRLQVDDTVLALVGGVFTISSYIIRGLAPTPWVLYLSAVVSCVGGFGMIIVRSLISKQVPDEEQGKVFSMLASWESIIPLLSSPVYTIVYNSSINTFPGACYFLSAGCYILAECAFIWLLVNRKPSPVTTTRVPDSET
ncbi:hypothetical protein Pcinc_022090 [Petrolisthes cinctipes]|uniref:Proton-coupled folate transporter n=1 Tax=Petrolisthes cinctipes TaxID=88211 RepID=A0AAE1FEQ7_PETCI|nr:hypothetical protein Pcinc_022090 [Petrolisthes cinctipes]